MLLDSYIRVSLKGGRSGERYISPDEQRKLINEGLHRAEAEHGVEVLEEDVSGAKAIKPTGDWSNCF